MGAIGSMVGKAVSGTVGPIVSGFIGAKGAKDAARAQIEASDRANDQTWRQYQQAQQGYAPWTTAGADSIGQLQKLLAEGGALRQNFNYNNLYSDPGYQFRLQEGQKALERSAAARGLGLSGAALKNMDNYSQGLASQEYNNAYGRWNNDQTNLYNRLMGLSQQGLGAENALQGWNQWATNSSNENRLGAGNARAAGIMGSANAWVNANNQIVKNFQDMGSMWGGGGGGQ